MNIEVAQLQPVQTFLDTSISYFMPRSPLDSHKFWSSHERGYCASVVQGARILRAGSRNYYQNFINIEIVLKIEI
jgi:hypothetical protein